MAEAEAEEYRIPRLGRWLQDTANDGGGFSRQPAPELGTPVPANLDRRMLRDALERPWHRLKLLNRAAKTEARRMSAPQTDAAREQARFDAFMFRNFGIGRDPAPMFFGIDPARPVAVPPPSPAAAHEAREAQRRVESTEADYARVDACIARLSTPRPTQPEFDEHAAGSPPS